MALDRGSHRKLASSLSCLQQQTAVASKDSQASFALTKELGSLFTPLLQHQATLTNFCTFHVLAWDRHLLVGFQLDLVHNSAGTGISHISKAVDTG